MSADPVESPDERPERRDGFRHPRLLEWLERERPRLTAAALTLLRGYVVAEGKAPGRRRAASWGSYESWSAWIRGCVKWLGLPDPLRTRRDLAADAASDAVVLATMVSGLEELLGELGGGATVRDMLSELARGDRREWYERLREGLAELVPELAVGQLPSPSQLGTLLRDVRGRVVGGRRVERAKKTRRGVLWEVVEGSRGVTV